MGLLQRFFLKILPRRMGESMRAESQSWFLRCLTCGYERSVWDIGGIRWGAYSKGKRTLCFCTKCDRLRWAACERKTLQVAQSESSG